jgi:hypothetical protein
LVLLSVKINTTTTTTPPPGLITIRAVLVNFYFGMQPDFNPTRRNIEDNLHFENGRRPQFFLNGRRHQIFWQLEDDLNFLENGRRPQFFGNGI